MKFSKLQKDNLKKYIDIYKKYSRNEEYKKDVQDRQERKRFYQSFTTSKIKAMTEYDFTQFIGKLWASRIFGNKEYMTKRIIENNGFDKVKNELIKLLYGKGKFEERYEGFSENIKYLGPSMITEVLCHIYSQQCGIWNEIGRKALKILKFKELPLNKYRISAEEYEKFNDTLLKISGELKKNGFKDTDLLFVDYFLWDVCRFFKEEKQTIEVEKVGKESYDFDHDEIKEKVYQIGFWLGFEAEMEKIVSKGAKVDIVWQAKIANLGIVSYIFEVQKRGSIDSLILNLQKARKNSTVQRLIVVSNKKQIEQIKNEAEDLEEGFKNSMSYWEINKVQRVHQNLSEITEIIEDLNLIQKEF